MLHRFMENQRHIHSSTKSFLTVVSCIYFCEFSLQKPDNDDVAFRYNFDTSILHRISCSVLAQMNVHMQFKLCGWSTLNN